MAKKKPKGKKYNPMAHELNGRKYRQRRVPDKRKAQLDKWINDDTSSTYDTISNSDPMAPSRRQRT